MKDNTHPEYVDCAVVCLCGSGRTWQTRSTVPEIRTEICSQCHPFYTGQQRILDSAGRVEKFKQKYEKFGQKKASR